MEDRMKNINNFWETLTGNNLIFNSATDKFVIKITMLHLSVAIQRS